MALTEKRLTVQLPPAMEGIVGELQLDNKNWLDLEDYSNVSQTVSLAADPAVVHFGGFQLGQVYIQTLHIRNVSSKGLRMHIIPPTTPYFKTRCDGKQGLLAPGLAESIQVEFCPQQYRYYTDSVRIHSEDGNMTIPLHGYPVMNETKFPRKVDFGVGKVALGDRTVKRFKMECKVPMDFEYEILLVKPNNNFTVEPQKGIVPAHGHVTIVITFEPLSLATQHLELEVRVAEFNSQPVRCVVTGCASPGLAKERMLQAAILGEDMATAGSGIMTPPMQLPKLTMEQLDGIQLVKTAMRQLQSNKGGGTACGGAGGGDAYTVMLGKQRKQQTGLRDCRKTGPIVTYPPQLPPPLAEVVVDGVYVPASALTAVADVTYVLNQQPGKLRIKDVKDAIRSKQAEQAAHRAALESILAQGLGSGVHPLERPEVPPHVKAALFAQLLSQAEEAARRVALGSGVHVGDDIMAAEVVVQAQQLREDQHTQHQRNTELAAAQRLETLLEPAGALHLPLAGTRGHQGQLNCAEGSADQRALSGAAFAATPASTDHLYTPAWRLIESNDLGKRADSQVQFQRAAWRIIYNARLRKSLARIQGVLAQLGWDKQRLAEESANPVLLVSEADRPGTAPTKYLKPDNVRTRPLPLYRDINFTFHGAVRGSHYTDFDELGPQVPRTPLQYRVLGYQAAPFPGLTPYTPPLLDQPLMEGAMEERGAESLAPSGPLTLAEVAALPEMPDAMRQAPYTTLEIGNRYTEDKVHALPEPSWGLDTTCLIQPELLSFFDSGAVEAAASGSVRALVGGPTLSQAWLPRKERWSAQLQPEVLPALMAGPDPTDFLNDSPEDADKPAINIQVPTDEEIAALLPPGMKNMLLQRPPLPSHAARQPNGAAAQQHRQQSSSVNGDMWDKDVVGGTQGVGSSGAEQPFELLRNRRQAELDASKRAARMESIQKLESNLKEYNSTLKRPGTFALKLPVRHH